MQWENKSNENRFSLTNRGDENGFCGLHAVENETGGNSNYF